MKEELKKIDLDINTKPQEPMEMKPFPWKFILFPIAGLILVVLLLAILLFPLKGVIAKVQDVARSGKSAAQSLKNQDLTATK